MLQSARPRRARLDLPALPVDPPHAVAIRAPAKGATQASAISSDSHSTGCNPRAREGRDTKPSCYRRKLLELQSARPRRARPGASAKFTARRRELQSARPRRARPRRSVPRPVLSPPSCNPRAREGRDLIIIVVILLLFPVAIRAPAKGATILLRRHNQLMFLLQSARPRRARLIILKLNQRFI